MLWPLDETETSDQNSDSYYVGIQLFFNSILILFVHNLFFHHAIVTK
jgi:hypothetical protein